MNERFFQENVWENILARMISYYCHINITEKDEIKVTYTYIQESSKHFNCEGSETSFTIKELKICNNVVDIICGMPRDMSFLNIK